MHSRGRVIEARGGPRERYGHSQVCRKKKDWECLEPVKSKGRDQGEGEMLGLEGCCRKAWLQSCLSREIKGPSLDLRQ